jgi:hypothetical protein
VSSAHRSLRGLTLFVLLPIGNSWPERSRQSFMAAGSERGSVTSLAFMLPLLLAHHPVVSDRNAAPLFFRFALPIRAQLKRSTLAMEYARRGRSNFVVVGFYPAPSGLCAFQLFPNGLWRAGCSGEPSALALSDKRGHFIGGEINSQIEKAAAEAGHRDVRRPEARRSGGTGLNTSTACD